MQYIILGLMRHGEARHGYALVKEYYDRTGFRISVGHVYRELQRLRARQWVDAVTNPPGADPRRLPYAITPVGIAAFESWLASHASVVPATCHDELAVRVFFLSDASFGSRRGTFDLWREELSVHRQLCERLRDDAHREATNGVPSASVRTLLLGRRLAYLAADLAFIDAVRSACKDDHDADAIRPASSRARSRIVGRPKRSSAG